MTELRSDKKLTAVIAVKTVDKHLYQTWALVPKWCQGVSIIEWVPMILLQGLDAFIYVVSEDRCDLKKWGPADQCRSGWLWWPPCLPLLPNSILKQSYIDFVCWYFTMVMFSSFVFLEVHGHWSGGYLSLHSSQKDQERFRDFVCR